MPIEFEPTYKRDFKSNLTYINKKEQCPSYCDRVLVKQNCKQSKINFIKYASCDEVLGSDHRPVYLHYKVGLVFEHYMDPYRLMNPITPH